jgi:hypothetical protein
LKIKFTRFLKKKKKKEREREREGEREREREREREKERKRERERERKKSKFHEVAGHVSCFLNVFWVSSVYYSLPHSKSRLTINVSTKEVHLSKAEANRT